MQGTDDNGFRLLWPILFLERTLPGHEYANLELARLILEQDAVKEQLTTDYLGGNLLASNNAAIEWLNQCIEKTALDYCTRAGMNYRVPAAPGITGSTSYPSPGTGSKLVAKVEANLVL